MKVIEDIKEEMKEAEAKLATAIENETQIKEVLQNKKNNLLTEWNKLSAVSEESIPDKELQKEKDLSKQLEKEHRAEIEELEGKLNDVNEDIEKSQVNWKASAEKHSKAEVQHCNKVKELEKSIESELRELAAVQDELNQIREKQKSVLSICDEFDIDEANSPVLTLANAIEKVLKNYLHSNLIFTFLMIA